MIERVNYDAMGWEKSKTTDDRLFAVRTVLWGFPVGAEVPNDVWPILEVGEHLFPFTCQMPVINFPPTFQHHLIATAFNMVVSIERPKHVSILSKPITLQFQPIIETMPVKNLHALVQETRLTQHILAQVSIPRLAYNIHEDPLSIPVTVQFVCPDEHWVGISQLQAYIKRCYQINYKTFSRSEAVTIVSHQMHKLPTHSNTLNFQLKLSDQKEEELPPTLTYSNHLTIEYRLVVAVKVRHGPLNIKKKLFDAPLTLGTLPPGTSAPRQLEAYSNIVDNRSSANSKPTFLRPEPLSEEEFLPAYDSEGIPPSYRSNIPRNVHLTASIQS
ncbi:hypothetical protein G6F56_007813 [Rhizopus delemar]|uniref:Arrestin C-terminal-like domain-containing protein n=1 Tax=Rhizopus stolonifer TaxID=4846 RepID=A0A367J5Q5_RHIST|nr:hypothetical protein G6F56_007813 [Rhizopus delemar]RCH85236.1 hypothetical protein CU098_007886 [Rhizopus stolonifer]